MKYEKLTNYYNYGYAANQITMIAGDYLHNLGFCGQGMTIAVIDAGFWYVDTIAAFDSLWINNQILGTKDFVSPGGNVFRAALAWNGSIIYYGSKSSRTNDRNGS